MKIGAVIAEYNPFHNGHAYQLRKFREESDADCVIVVMSGCFVQRGEPAICDKYTRAEWALRGGADMVIELPVYYACANAQNFARGAVGILSGIADCIGFGAETDSLNAIIRASEIDISEYCDSREGKNYARGVYEQIAADYDPEVANIYASPNSTLAMEYLRAARSICPDMEFHVIKRVGANHDDIDAEGIYASATAIRNMLGQGEDAGAYIPDFVDIRKTVTLRDMDRLLLYNLRTISDDALAGIADVTEGIDRLIKKNVDSVTSYEELLNTIKTKRYTMARLKRIGLSALLGITGEMSESSPQYVHITGVRERVRRALIAEVSRRTSLRVLCKGSDYKSYTESVDSLTKTDVFATNIYGLFCGELPNSDYYKKLPII